jgi:hypothetical protein
LYEKITPYTQEGALLKPRTPVLMARKDDKESELGISSMLLYHATIIIHGTQFINFTWTIAIATN